MTPIIVPPLPGAGYAPRFLAFLRGVISVKRQLLRLAGIPTVILEGRVIGIRAVPLGVARKLVPALMRCSHSFSVGEINEALFNDFVVVLSLGLRVSTKSIENLTVPLWQLVPLIDQLAQVNGLSSEEAGSADLGKIMAAMRSIGMDSLPGLPPTPGGPGSTSNNV